MVYTSTRDNSIRVSASEAILRGLAPGGGLFVPESIPALGMSIEEIAKLDYRQTAYEVMKLFLTDFTEEELKGCIERAYDSKFDTPDIAPVKKVGDVYYLELFHGATIAFKDMALSILPHLLTVSAKKNNIHDEIVILTATSGDTGKAAMAGFADVPGTRILVFYPKGGVSKVQERQMVTQKGENVRAVGVKGNFDDCQSAVKKIFEDVDFARRISEKGFRFSSANSINIGRLVPQIVYYVYACGELVRQGAIKPGERINVTVPTGNFGNILAACYAKKMGLPIERLICASNENKVLFDFFESGVYDRNREFILTSSPSMDILISSNLERLIYHISGDDSERTAAFMAELSEGGRYEITGDMRERLSDFYGGYADQAMTARKISDLYRESGYVIDTHTAVAAAVYDGFRKATGDDRCSLIVSTASPYKFTHSVMTAIDEKYGNTDEIELADELEKISGTDIPGAIREIKEAPVRHDLVYDRTELYKAVEDFLA